MVQHAAPRIERYGVFYSIGRAERRGLGRCHLRVGSERKFRAAVLRSVCVLCCRDIVRAAQESIAYQSADLVLAMEKDTGLPLKALKVDGGASRDGFLMQFQADILGVEVVKPALHEATALGAASLAGLTVGLWKDLDTLKQLRETQVVYTPTMSQEERTEKLTKWHKAVSRSLAWEEK